jgi:hypothetical protein
MTAWIVISTIVLAPILLRTPKALAPLRVDLRDPSRFDGLFRRKQIRSFTGYASEFNKHSATTVSGSVSSSYNPAGGGSVSGVRGEISSTTVITDAFFLNDGKGHVESVKVEGFDAHVGSGHRASVASVARRGRGAYFLIYDHTTGRVFYQDKVISRYLTFPFPAFYIVTCAFTGLGIPVLVVWGVILPRIQQRRFKSKGVKPLLTALAKDAANLPTDSASKAGAGSDAVSSQLRELAALRESGALSESEFSAAKAKLLEA